MIVSSAFKQSNLLTENTMKQYFLSILFIFTLSSETSLNANLNGSHYILSDQQINSFLKQQLKIAINNEWDKLFEGIEDVQENLNLNTLKTNFNTLKTLISDAFEEYTNNQRKFLLSDCTSLEQIIDSSLQQPANKEMIFPLQYLENDIRFCATLEKSDHFIGFQKNSTTENLCRVFPQALKALIVEHYSWPSFLVKLDVGENELTRDTIDTRRPLLYIDVAIKSALKEEEEEEDNDIHTLVLKSCHVNQDKFITMQQIIQKKPSLLKSILSRGVQIGFTLGNLYLIWEYTGLREILTFSTI